AAISDAARAGEEARAALAGEAGPSFPALARLSLIPNILAETFRLSPPIPIFARRPRQVELVTDIAVRETGLLFISPWHLGRHQAFWPDPKRFDPDRWKRRGQGTQPGMHYIPFSEGKRSCPGAGMARLELTALLTQIFAAFEIEAVPGAEPAPLAGLALGASDGIMLSLRPRADG
ncbi:MAG: cytochrome P450, partial [Pseudomonadota bacterium]